jgi:hypothetical protein
VAFPGVRGSIGATGATGATGKQGPAEATGATGTSFPGFQTNCSGPVGMATVTFCLNIRLLFQPVSLSF